MNADSQMSTRGLSGRPLLAGQPATGPHVATIVALMLTDLAETQRRSGLPTKFPTYRIYPASII